MALTVSDIAELRETVIRTRARLVTTAGVMRPLGVDDDPDALVSELLRLARLGAVAEQLSIDNPTLQLEQLLRAFKPGRATVSQRGIG